MDNTEIAQGIIQLQILRLEYLKEKLPEIQKFQEVFGRCIEVMETPENAWLWLDSPNIAFGHVSPVEILLSRPDGVQEILDLLGRIEYGVFL